MRFLPLLPLLLSTTMANSNSFSLSPTPSPSPHNAAIDPALLAAYNEAANDLTYMYSYVIGQIMDSVLTSTNFVGELQLHTTLAIHKTSVCTASLVLLVILRMACVQLLFFSCALMT